MSDFRVTIGSLKGLQFVNVYVKEVRYRYWNAKKLGLEINAIDNPALLKSAFEIKLLEGWRPTIKKNLEKKPILYIREVIQKSVLQICNSDYSDTYKRDCRRVLKLWEEYESENIGRKLTIKELRINHFEMFLKQQRWSFSTQRIIKSTLSPLLREWKESALKNIKIKKVASNLHKPLPNITEVFRELKDYNENLYLACLLTYSCLLRPHIECRLLKWSDVNLEKGFISLSGKQNKSGRNRIVPLTERVKTELTLRVGEQDEYVLSRTKKPYNTSYLSTLWSRYRHQSNKVGSEHTLYSFRHHGAIQVFEKTGSLLKLQQVMGHSDMKVSLTYLRGLEVKQLQVEDLPGF
jgi:integrase